MADKSRVFRAEYPDTCGRGDEIQAGELVRYVGATLYHEDCATDAAEAREDRYTGTTMEEMGF